MRAAAALAVLAMVGCGDFVYEGTTTGAGGVAATTGHSTSGHTGGTGSTTAATTTGTGTSTTAGSTGTTSGSTGVVSCAGYPDNVQCTLAAGDPGVTADGGLVGSPGSCCGGSCVYVYGDPANCYGCGLQCPAGSACTDEGCTAGCSADGGCLSDQSCVPFQAGRCLAPQSCPLSAQGDVCSLGDGIGACCFESCVDTQSDPNDCGGCSIACASDQYCSQGTCVTAADCTQAESYLSACNLSGGGQGLCYDGTCQTVDCSTFPAGTSCNLEGGGQGVCCGGCVAASTLTEDANCGRCGYICPSGSSCGAAYTGGDYSCYVGPTDGGVAICDPDAEAIPGALPCPSGTVCANVQCLSQSCGPNDDMVPCAGTAGSDLACCASACIDLSADDLNCGGCGVACGAGTFCSAASGFPQCQPNPTCDLGNDGIACPLSTTGNGLCCQGSCVDPTSDAQNCSACGIQCAAGATCAQSACTESCETDAACPTGMVCANSNCVAVNCPPTEVGLACAFGFVPNGSGVISAEIALGTCCSGSCANLQQDPLNCGACGTGCSGGVCGVTVAEEQQSAPLCVPPTPGSSDCSAVIEGCPASTVCVGHQCLPTSCAGPNFGNSGLCSPDGVSFGFCCGGFETQAACVNPASDALNCGGCGVVCAAGQTCAQGVCSGATAACPAGSENRFCDLDAGHTQVCCAGGCANLLADPQNCGTCGNSCPAGDACADGQCVVTACAAATQDQLCGLDAGGTGVCCGSSCLDTAHDRQNCGRCGTTCPGSETCNGSACGLDTCGAATQGDACHFDAGGVEYLGDCCSSACVNESFDSQNCGGCGVQCVDAGCYAGQCD